MISRNCLFVLILFGFFVIPGCRGPKVKGLVPVQGTVTYKGEPIENAAVCFTPKNFKAGDRLGAGKTNAKGQFELRTIGDLGVLPGEYIVVVVKNERTSGTTPAQLPRVDPKTGRNISIRPSLPIKSFIPKRYNNPNTSGVSVDVGKEGLRDWHLELVD